MNTTNCCPLCGGARVPGQTTFSTELGFGVVLVRHVPAQICDQCGEDWIEDEVAIELEKIVQQAREKHTVVEVAEWQERVAA